VATVSEPLNRSTFPRAPEELLLPTVETVELEQEQTLEAWADAHPHATIALRMVDDRRTIPARYCSRCRELRTLREEIPIRRYFEQPTWRIWLDVVGLLTAVPSWRIGRSDSNEGVRSPSAYGSLSSEGTLRRFRDAWPDASSVARGAGGSDRRRVTTEECAQNVPDSSAF
jgi:hypothetical protein